MIITFLNRIQSTTKNIHIVLKSQKLSVAVHKWSFYLLMYIISIFISIKPIL